MEENDVQLQLKKRARRRLVGAVAFVSFAAVILPVIMDQEPRQPVQDVEIRIPGQDEKAFAPKFAAAPAEKPVAAERPAEAKPAVEAKAPVVPEANSRVVETVREPAPEKPAAKPEKVAEKVADKPADKPVDKAPEKSPEKPPPKPEKPAEKVADKPKGEDAKRAAAILSDKPAAAPGKAGEYLILIGAFANEANVKILKEKLGQEGIKTFTEPLDTPQGRKTRVRAGPFASREAADKALEKMQKIGVSGVVSAK